MTCLKSFCTYKSIGGIWNIFFCVVEFGHKPILLHLLNLCLKYITQYLVHRFSIFLQRNHRWSGKLGHMKFFEMTKKITLCFFFYTWTFFDSAHSSHCLSLIFCIFCTDVDIFRIYSCFCCNGKKSIKKTKTSLMAIALAIDASLQRITYFWTVAL